MISNTCIKGATLANSNPNPSTTAMATVTSNNDWCEDDFFAMN